MTIPNSRAIDFVSAINGHRYRINIALPSKPPPPNGYAVLYVLDGTMYFGTATEAVRANANAPDVVVVGIGYPQSDAFIADSEARWGAAPSDLAALNPMERARRRERTYDLTLPASEEQLDASPIPRIPSETAKTVGGADDLLRTIERDVKPRVEALLKVDSDRQVLFGHSLGGLVSLHALFTEPDAFRTFVVASPSIWWNHSAVLNDEPRFTAAIKSNLVAPRILITVGALEQTSEPEDSLYGMVSNATALAGRLSALKALPGYEVTLAVFPDQGHGISPWPAIGRAVEFAFQRSPRSGQ